ncbi:MAG: hypothetical protein Q8K70_04345 [Bacteroidota bacterium]|nr:hypothetical protein [Bacteroidota bacterium]
MKQTFIPLFFILILASCSSVRQATNKVGQTDDLYFTASDTRKVNRVSQQELESRKSLQEQSVRNESYAGSYTNSYSNRFRHFGNNRSFYYQTRPTIVPVVSYNPFMGWNTSFAYMDPRFMGMNTFNSPFSPFYGWNMPFNDPFYASGWGGSWMTGYYPTYIHNPFMYNGCFPGMYGYNDPFRFNGFYGNGFNSYYGQNFNRNNWGSNRNNNNNSQPTNYSRRTGSSNNMPASNANTPAPQGSAQPAAPSSGNRWYSGSTSPSSSGSSSSSSSSSSSGSSSSGSSSGRWYSGSTSPSSGGSSSSGSSSSGSSGSSSGGGSTRRR